MDKNISLVFWLAFCVGFGSGVWVQQNMNRENQELKLQIIEERKKNIQILKQIKEHGKSTN